MSSTQKCQQRQCRQRHSDVMWQYYTSRLWCADVTQRGATVASDPTCWHVILLELFVRATNDIVTVCACQLTCRPTSQRNFKSFRFASALYCSGHYAIRKAFYSTIRRN